MFMYIIQRAASFGVGRKNYIFKLGELTGAWSDLIDESADKTPDVIQAFQKRVAVRKMPDVRYKTVNLTTQGWRGRQRTYYFAQTSTGATMVVHIGPYGRDLYVSWKLFLRPVWDWMKILLLFGLILGTGFFAGFEQNPWTGRYEFSITRWFFASLIVFLIMVGTLMLDALTSRRNPLAYFAKSLDLPDVDEIMAMALAIHYSLVQALGMAGVDVTPPSPEDLWQGRTSKSSSPL